MGGVSEKARQAFDAWKEADAMARDAETQLARAWEKYFSRHGEGPPERELIREVARLRVLANAKLGTAMEALGAHPGDASQAGSRATRSTERPS
jgi:ferric-dicitrate binding protein FerR (iron transport regulator)